MGKQNFLDLAKWRGQVQNRSEFTLDSILNLIRLLILYGYLRNINYLSRPKIIGKYAIYVLRIPSEIFKSKNLSLRFIENFNGVNS